MKTEEEGCGLEQPSFRSSPIIGRKRKADSLSSSSSSDWDPDGADVESKASSQTKSPPAIKAEVDENHQEKLSVASHVNQQQSDNFTKPPERIRYEMLGAPTLLYRHAPSYADPGFRPSTLSPMQISVARYTNTHSMAEWFGNKPTRRQRTVRNPLLSHVHIPQSPRCWGEPHELDLRQQVKSAKRKSVLDTELMLSEGDRESSSIGNASSSAKEARKSNINKSEQSLDDADSSNHFDSSTSLQQDTPAQKMCAQVNPQDNIVNGRKNSRGNVKGKTNGYNIFRSEYMVAHPITSDCTSKREYLLNCSKKTGELWRNFSEQEKVKYKQIAAERNASLMTIDPKQDGKSESGSKCSESGGNNQNADDESTAKEPQQSETTKRQTSYQVFLSDFYKSHPLPVEASKEERQTHLIKCSKQASSVWKKMNKKQKATYGNRAKRSTKRKSNTTSFNVFRAELMQNTEHGLESLGKSDRQRSLLSFSKVASEEWKKMSQEQKDVYKGKAREMNKERAPRSGKGRAGRTTSWIVYRAEALETLTALHPLSENASESERKCHKKNLLKEIGSEWKTLPRSEKDRYKAIAKERNAVVQQQPIRGTTGLSRADGDSSQMSEQRIAESSACASSTADGMSLTADNEEEAMPDEAKSDEMNSQELGVGGPSAYGNCMFTFQHRDSQSVSSYMVRPTGDDLSSVTLSKIRLPTSPDDGDGEDEKSIELDARVLQIANFVGDTLLEGSIKFVVRTSLSCTVMSVEASISGPPVQLCKGPRIDMNSSLLSYLPTYVACDSKSLSHFTQPSFSILSLDGIRSTAVHCVSLREDGPFITVHDFARSLADISLIEYDRRDRTALWAAARSAKLPKLSLGFHKARSGYVTGYGHSLYRIDLTTDEPTLVWSPSNALYFSEGVHSLSGIKPDESRDHLLWASSTSACRVWCLDVRHERPRVVATWSLPLLADDFGIGMPVTGIYGAGTLMVQPRRMDGDREPALFCVKKDPDTATLGVHQLPDAGPRFHTQPLEASGYDVDRGPGCVARSTALPLPDRSPSVYNVGIATLRCPASSVLGDAAIGRLGLRRRPARATVVVTMTCLGDLYCHTLLEADASEPAPSRPFPGLPVGARAIPIPQSSGAVAARGLRVALRNRFPVPSGAISSYVVSPDDDGADVECDPSDVDADGPEGDGEDAGAGRGGPGGYEPGPAVPRPLRETLEARADPTTGRTWTLGRTERLVSYRSARGPTADVARPVDADGAERPASAHRASSHFAVEGGGDDGRPSRRADGIRLPVGHMTVAAPAEREGAADAAPSAGSDAWRSGDIDPSLIRRLMGSFFSTRPVKAEEEDVERDEEAAYL